MAALGLRLSTRLSKALDSIAAKSPVSMPEGTSHEA